MTVGMEGLIPNLHERYELRDLRGHGLPEIERVAALYRELGGLGGHAKRVYFGPTTPQLLGTFGATWLLSQTGPPPTPAIRPAPGTVGGATYVVDAVPRAFVATDWRSVPDEETARSMTIASSIADLRSRPVIEGAPAPPRAGGEPRAARFVEDHDVDVRLTVDAPRGGWLVLLDSFYPGWHASVDGESADILPANSAFRAVRLPPGAREVTFAYRPATIIGGALLSVLACAAIAALLVGRPLRRRRRRST
jgi:hypothetical protein